MKIILPRYLVAGSGAGPCGRPLWLSEPIEKMFGRKVIYSNFVKRISCHSSSMACFLDRLLHEMRLSGEIWSYVGGTSVPNLNDQSLLDEKIIVLPPVQVLDAFEVLVRLIQAKLFSSENETLAILRDTLLPKLISGELRVRDAERFIGRVV